MADAINGVNLSELHNKIVETLALKFGQDFKLIEFYRDQEERKAPTGSELPALLLELSDFEPDLEKDAGGEQLPIIAHFEARVVVDAMVKGNSSIYAKVKVRELATKLAHYLFQNKRFHGLHAGALTVNAITEDAFYPALDRFDVWRVDFAIPVLIGESFWLPSGTTPLAFYSYSPVVGSDNQSEYLEVDV